MGIRLRSASRDKPTSSTTPTTTPLAHKFEKIALNSPITRSSVKKLVGSPFFKLGPNNEPLVETTPKQTTGKKSDNISSVRPKRSCKNLISNFNETTANCDNDEDGGSPPKRAHIEDQQSTEKVKSQSKAIKKLEPTFNNIINEKTTRTPRKGTVKNPAKINNETMQVDYSVKIEIKSPSKGCDEAMVCDEKSPFKTITPKKGNKFNCSDENTPDPTKSPTKSSRCSRNLRSSVKKVSFVEQTNIKNKLKTSRKLNFNEDDEYDKSPQQRKPFRLSESHDEDELTSIPRTSPSTSDRETDDSPEIETKTIYKGPRNLLLDFENASYNSSSQQKLSSSPSKSFLSRASNPIVQAKRLLSVNTFDSIVGREKECKELRDWLEEHLKTQQSTSLYISGPPGTGKTASVTSIICKLKQSYPVTYLNYNAMDFHLGSTIYSRIANDLGATTKDKTRYMDQIIKTIEKLVTKSKKMVVLLLDEIDGLDSKNQDLLYTIFDWPRIKESKLILIGIANTLDFTSRSLSKMDSFKLNCIKQISFRPYNKQQIVDILQARLNQINAAYQIISKSALDLCALKVSSYSGDARKALDICRRAIELAEREVIQNRIQSSPILRSTADDGNNPGSPRKSPRKLDTTIFMSTQPLVGPKHIMSILSQVFGSKLFTEDSVQTLTIQQQIILCSVLCYAREKRVKDIEVSRLNQLYIKACTKTGIASNTTTNTDFLCICQILESRGLIHIKQAKDVRLSKVSLSVNEEEVAQRLKEKSVIQTLLTQFHSLL